MNVYALIGKLTPWALGAVSGLLTILGVLPNWWATVAAVVTGIVQIIIATGPKK